MTSAQYNAQIAILEWVAAKALEQSNRLARNGCHGQARAINDLVNAVESKRHSIRLQRDERLRTESEESS